MLRGRSISILALTLLALPACQAGARGGTDDGGVTVTATDFEFEGPRSIASGWSTFRFVNEGEQEHFVLLWRLPEGRTMRDWRTDVTNTFEAVWERYDGGELTREETLQALGEELPAWYFEEVQAAGGAALTEPGRTSQVSLELESGAYAMECYVKTPQGTWHTSQGMVRGLTVTEDSTGAEPPEADVELTLSNYEITTSGELTAGTHTVAVHAADTPDGFAPHDVNLFRLEGEETVDDVVTWMDWMDLEQFRAPAPGTSLGGVEHLPAGETGYMTVTLEPGRYAWVSELYGGRGMAEEFTVE